MKLQVNLLQVNQKQLRDAGRSYDGNLHKSAVMTVNY